MTLPFSLQCWYLHLERTVQFAGGISIDPHLFRALPGETGEHLAKMQLHQCLQQAILNRMAKDPPPSIEQLLLTHTIAPGAPCIIYKTFRSRGLTQAAMKRKHLSNPPILRTALNISGIGEYVITVPIDPARFTANSSYSHFHRRDTHLFVAGFVESVAEKEIHILPCVVASALNASITVLPVEIMPMSSEEHVDTIDSFKRVCHEPRPPKIELSNLKTVAEADVKNAFGNILGEPSVPKDWGGEKSDLYSTHIMLRERRRSAAFLFKGPSKQGPMTLAHLGKNGDQLLRLSTEPAEVLILQHSDEITPPVRELLRVIANQLQRVRRYCVIDGYDTLRLLRAYSQCGFSPTSCST